MECMIYSGTMGKNLIWKSLCWRNARALYDLRDGNNQENLYGSVSSISKATDGSAGSIVRVENASVNTPRNQIFLLKV